MVTWQEKEHNGRYLYNEDDIRMYKFKLVLYGRVADCY